MSTVTIETSGEPFETSEKRFYVPGTVIRSACPYCGESIDKDLSVRPLMCPTANTPIEVGFYHEGENGSHEWTVRVVLRIAVEAVALPAAEACVSAEKECRR